MGTARDGVVVVVVVIVFFGGIGKFVHLTQHFLDFSVVTKL